MTPHDFSLRRVILHDTESYVASPCYTCKYNKPIKLQCNTSSWLIEEEICIYSSSSKSNLIKDNITIHTFETIKRNVVRTFPLTEKRADKVSLGQGVSMSKTATHNTSPDLIKGNNGLVREHLVDKDVSIHSSYIHL